MDRLQQYLRTELGRLEQDLVQNLAGEADRARGQVRAEELAELNA